LRNWSRFVSVHKKKEAAKEVKEGVIAFDLSVQLKSRFRSVSGSIYTFIKPCWHVAPSAMSPISA
jgi:hypothetical protein